MYITDSSTGKTGLLVSIGFIRWLLVYHVAVWFMFTLIYKNIDFEKHFEVPDDFTQSFSEVAYYSYQCVVQMYGTSIVPKTTVGRSIVSMQSFLTYSIVVIMLAPWSLLPLKGP
jgi:hypothetical protein